MAGAGIVFILVGVILGRAIISLGMVLMAAAIACTLFDKGSRSRAVWFMHRRATWLGPWGAWLAVLLLGVVADLVHDPHPRQLHNLRIQAPLLLAAGALVVAQPWTPALHRRLYWLVGLPVFITGILTLLHYALHVDHVNTLISQSTAAPIILPWQNPFAEQTRSGMLHIYFGIFCTLLMLYGLKVWLAFRPASRLHRALLIASGLVLVLCIHGLGSRTGLVAAYAGAGCWVLHQAIGRKSWKILGGAALAVLLVAALAWNLPGLKRRWHNTLHELEMFTDSQHPKNLSVTHRLMAWRTSAQLLMANPLGLGPAAGDILERQLLQSGVEPRKHLALNDPHNQYMQFGLNLGWPGVLLLVYALVSGLHWPGLRRSGLWAATMGGLGAAMASESILQRQQGIALALGFIVLALLAAQPRNP